ncbi:hypothetical protein A3K42_00305 [candidate division WWE3 bacterium RBG_13_37_7]|uniref:Uncharacterized protein n=1 Tax=candidate division WWE3 bacterium RBG_13_37_7 TaxID=1802609 RepID=A0A1F4U225_UNCKA|nr:MAG: hypothetical protein A3K42_00305 [candidate division WWE3 bacterium RBG_13_37_7]
MDKNKHLDQKMVLSILFTFIVALALGFYAGRYYERTSVRKTFQSRMQGRSNGGQGRGGYQQGQPNQEQTGQPAPATGQTTPATVPASSAPATTTE